MHKFRSIKALNCGCCFTNNQALDPAVGFLHSQPHWLTAWFDGAGSGQPRPHCDWLYSERFPYLRGAVIFYWYAEIFCVFFSCFFHYIYIYFITYIIYINTCWVALRRFNQSYLLTSCGSLLIFVRGVDPCIVLTAVALLVGDANPNPNSNPDPNSNNSDSVRWRCEP